MTEETAQSADAGDCGVMLDYGLPDEPGWYWTLRRGTKFTEHGTAEIVWVQRTGSGALWGDGFGDMTLDEIGFAWQRVKPFDVREGK